MKLVRFEQYTTGNHTPIACYLNPTYVISVSEFRDGIAVLEFWGKGDRGRTDPHIKSISVGLPIETVVKMLEV